MRGKKINGVGPFEQKWGERAEAIAEREGVSPTSIFMRVSKFGTPYQRRAKPNKIEAKYGKTQLEIARELDIHPQSVGKRERDFGDVYRKSNYYGPSGQCWGQTDWRNDPKWNRMEKFWLMPEHPDYERARKGGWTNEK